MLTYKDMLNTLNSITGCKKGNLWLQVHLFGQDKNQEQAFAKKSPEDRFEELHEMYNNHIPAMGYEVSEFCYAASNGYVEFFLAFSLLPESERYTALKDNNGGLALLFAINRRHKEVVQILLKQKFIQEILNQPYQRAHSNAFPVKFNIQMDIADKLPFVPFAGEREKGDNKGDAKENAKLENQQETFTYGQLAYLLAINKKEPWDIFDTLMVEPHQPDKIVKKQGGTKVADKLNFICQHLLTKAGEQDKFQTWQYNKKNSTAHLICNSYAQYHYLNRYFSQYFKFKTPELTAAWENDIDRSMLENGPSFPILYIKNIDIKQLTNCTVIPPVSWVHFCADKVLAFTKGFNPFSSIKTSTTEGGRTLLPIKCRANPPLLTPPFGFEMIVQDKKDKKVYTLVPFDYCEDPSMLVGFRTAAIQLFDSSVEPDLKENLEQSIAETEQLNLQSNQQDNPSTANPTTSTQTVEKPKMSNTEARRRAKKRAKAKSKKMTPQESSLQNATPITVEEAQSASHLSHMISEGLPIILTEDEQKTIEEEKLKKEIETSKQEIRDKIYFFPAKIEKFLAEKNSALQALHHAIHNRAASIASLLKRLRSATIELQAADKNDLDKNLRKRDPHKGKIASFDSKDEQIKRFLQDANGVLKKSEAIETKFDEQFKESHVTVLKLADAGELDQARTLLSSFDTIFSDYDLSYQALCNIDNEMERMEKNLLDSLSISHRKQVELQDAKAAEEIANEAAISAQKEKDRKIEIDTKKEQELEQKKLAERLRKRERWFADQAAYEAQKAIDRQTEQQNKQRNSVFAPLYARTYFAKYRNNFKKKEPSPLLLNIKAGKIDYRCRLANELAQMDRLLRLSQEKRPTSLKQFQNERFAIRGTLARLFEVVRYLQAGVFPEKQAAALRIYLFKGPEFQIKDESDLKQNMEINERLIDLTLKLLIYCRLLSQKKILATAPSLQGLLVVGSAFTCDILDELSKKALLFMEQTKCHREFAPNLTALLNTIEADKKSLFELSNTLDNKIAGNQFDTWDRKTAHEANTNNVQNEIHNFARIFLYAHLGYHCWLLKKHYFGVYNNSQNRDEYKTFIKRGNAIRHEDSLPATILKPN